jgi:hypothetical protein
MTAPAGKPVLPLSIQGHFVQMERRLNEAENRERGAGRRGWNEATILLAGTAPKDNGFPSWRVLNDGRVELRGRIDLKAVVLKNTNPGTRILQFSGPTAPPGDGETHISWLSVVAPCSAKGANPGVYRLDILRYLRQETWTENGIVQSGEAIYTDLIARPSENSQLTDWIGFDQVIYDPNLYIDTLAPVPADQHTRVFGRGEPRSTDGVHIVKYIPGEFGIAILGQESGGIVSVIPGVEMPSNP